MPMFKPAPEPAQSPQSSLRLPATRRIALETSQRLSTITEGGHLAPPPIPRRSILRGSTSTAASARTAPPPYEWVEERYGDAPEYQPHDAPPHAPIEGEDLAELRRKEWMGGKGMRGGWGRFAIVAVAFMAIVGLAVGLGVGLTIGRKHNTNNAGSGNDTASDPGMTPSGGITQQFPLGKYSFLTALREQSSNCTSNAATWSCYPYHVLDPTDSSTNTSSLATFNWVISNTSAIYPSNTTALTTGPEGVPANLTISSSNNPFAITFPAQPLTYAYVPGNPIAPTPRYTFAFTLPKVVTPSASISSDNTAAECFFNDTILSGNIHLAAEITFPAPDQGASASTGGYEPWPFAFGIEQSAHLEADVPDCYEMANGVIGQPITIAFMAQGGDCVCDYSNGP